MVEGGAPIAWRVGESNLFSDEALLCAEKHGRLTVLDKRIETAKTGFRGHEDIPHRR